jgi:hypothetical protein
MKTGLILAMAAALLLAGCGDMNCGADTTNGAGAGTCGLHTTFFAGGRRTRPPQRSENLNQIGPPKTAFLFTLFFKAL